MVLFDTSVVDVTDQEGDPVETIMKVQLGGGTDIGGALAYAAGLVDNPRRTIVVLITDFYEGALLEKWEEGWSVLFGALSTLNDADLSRGVTIRQQPMAVHDALNRSLAHVSYHVGQIVYIAKSIRGADWNSLSIPRGKSDDFNRKMRESK